MPKLSNARRNRRQLDLAGYCVKQAARQVSEEDIQEQTSDESVENEIPQQSETEMQDSRPRLKRREPSTCLSDLCLMTPLTNTASADEAQYERPGDGGGDTGRTLSPVWGHFVDVILDDDDRPSPRPLGVEKETPVWSDTFRSHSPYEETARKRLRIRSPQRPSFDNQLHGFLLQDPSTLHDALSRLSV